jgi:hypothetical protein
MLTRKGADVVLSNGRLVCEDLQNPVRFPQSD